MLKDLPFTVSPSAMAYLEEATRRIGADPEIARFVTTLRCAANETTLDAAGKFVSRYTGEFYCIGGDEPRQVSDWDRFRLGGAEVAIDPWTLDRLKGANLELEESRGGQRLVARRY